MGVGVGDHDFDIDGAEQINETHVQTQKQNNRSVSSHPKDYTYVGSVSLSLFQSYLHRTRQCNILVDYCILHSYPGISSLAKKLSSLWRARPGIDGSHWLGRMEEWIQEWDVMPDTWSLSFGGDELRKERQVVCETQIGRVLIYWIREGLRQNPRRDGILSSLWGHTQSYHSWSSRLPWWFPSLSVTFYVLQMLPLCCRVWIT